jgi:hypothetical protein
MGVHAARLTLPVLHDIDDVVGSFVAAGLEVAASRLRIGFVPVVGHTPKLMEWLDYYYEKKLLRFRPPRRWVTSWTTRDRWEESGFRAERSGRGSGEKPRANAT